jgi:hypothetical protein
VATGAPAKLDELLQQMLEGIEPGLHWFGLRCHPDVYGAIYHAMVAARFPFSSELGIDASDRLPPPKYGYASLYITRDLKPGHYEFHEGDRIVKAGVLDAATG